MSYTSYYPETDHATTETGQAGQVVVRSGSARYGSGVQGAPCNAETACALTQTPPLCSEWPLASRALSARVSSGLVLMPVNRQMGNRAFLHWVGGFHGRDRDPHTNELAAGGFRELAPGFDAPDADA